jgi:hypothetical protein
VSDTQYLILTIHRWVGYPMAFLLVPIALATFGGKVGHRLTGKAYLFCMLFMYATGTYLTLTRHEWMSWDFARNLTFNFLGFSLLFYGWRAMVLFRQPGDPVPQKLDYGLAALLTVSVAALASVAIWKDFPMRVFGVIGIVMVALEWREIRARFQPRDILLRRHVRFILASYFYVLTVVSLVHLNDELARSVKWLWPSAVGAAVIYLTTSERTAAALTPRAPVLRGPVLVTLVLSLLLGSYSLFKVWTGKVRVDRMSQAASSAQGETAR